MSTFVLEKTNTNRSAIVDNACKFIHALPIEKNWEIVVKRKTKDRTIPQCRYLNGVAYALLSEHTGHTRDEMSKYLCKRHFGTVTRLDPGGVAEEWPLRTTTTNEHGRRDVLEGRSFWDYVEMVQAFGAGMGVYIPDPQGLIPEHARA